MGPELGSWRRHTFRLTWNTKRNCIRSLKRRIIVVNISKWSSSMDGSATTRPECFLSLGESFSTVVGCSDLIVCISDVVVSIAGNILWAAYIIIRNWSFMHFEVSVDDHYLLIKGLFFRLPHENIVRVFSWFKDWNFVVF